MISVILMYLLHRDFAFMFASISFRLLTSFVSEQNSRQETSVSALIRPQLSSNVWGRLTVWFLIIESIEQYNNSVLLSQLQILDLCGEADHIAVVYTRP